MSHYLRAFSSTKQNTTEHAQAPIEQAPPPILRLSRTICSGVCSLQAILLLVLATGGSHPASAAILLTEIHYNGPSAGTDPDEFLELSNNGSAAVDMAGWAFGAGITYSFLPGFSLASGQSLVLARSEALFRSVFTDFSDQLLTFSGALSNSGETLSLLDAAGAALWSVSYDDGGAWPTSADGGGDSLQLRASAVNPSLAGSWEVAAPSPGYWSGFAVDTDTESHGAVTAPPTMLLLLGVLCLWPSFAPSRRDSRGGYSEAPAELGAAGSSLMPRRARFTVAASKLACAARVRWSAVK